MIYTAARDECSSTTEWWSYLIVLIMQTRKLKHRVTKQGAHNDTTRKWQSEDLNTDCLVAEPIMIHHYKYQNASRRGLRRNNTQLLPLSCSPSRNQEGLPTIPVIFFPSVKADCKGHFRGEAPSLGINKYSLWEKNQNKYFNFWSWEKIQKAYIILKLWNLQVFKQKKKEILPVTDGKNKIKDKQPKW